MMWLIPFFLSKAGKAKDYSRHVLVDEAHALTIHITLCWITEDGNMARTIGLC